MSEIKRRQDYYREKVVNILNKNELYRQKLFLFDAHTWHNGSHTDTTTQGNSVNIIFRNRKNKKIPSRKFFWERAYVKKNL